MTTNGNITYGQMRQYAPFLPRELLFTGLPFLDPAHIDDRRVAAVVQAFTEGIVAQGGKPDIGNDNIYDGALFVRPSPSKAGTASYGDAGPRRYRVAEELAGDQRTLRLHEVSAARAGRRFMRDRPLGSRHDFVGRREPARRQATLIEERRSVNVRLCDDIGVQLTPKAATRTPNGCRGRFGKEKSPCYRA